MKKEIKVLVRNESATYSSESLAYGDKKFKIVAENGNSYSRLNVYTYTSNGDLGLVACCNDIPQYKNVDYIWNEAQRLRGNAHNIRVAKEYIMKVF